MVGGTWLNPDGLFVQFGTNKAIPEVAGDYLSYGDTREIEATIVLSTLTAATPTVISNTTFFPSGAFIEEVIVDTEVGALGGTALSVGTMGMDRSTITGTYANTTFLNAAAVADFTTAGQKKSYTVGVATVGTGVGSAITFSQGAAYLTATATGTFTAGTIKVRIRYRGLGTITQ
jgi:hypothetical protein